MLSGQKWTKPITQIYQHNLLTLRVNGSPRGLRPFMFISGQKWTAVDKWTEVDGSGPLTSHLPAALEMVDKSENKRVHRLPISTCENVKVDKSGRIFSTFYLFFTFFLLYPYLPAIM